MKNKNSGLEFIETVGVVYVFALIFIHSLFMISGSSMTGNAIIGIPQNDSSILQQKQDQESLHNAVYIISIIFLLVLFIWIVVYFFVKKNKRETNVKIPRYSAVKTR